jgi:hypothetical protein
MPVTFSRPAFFSRSVRIGALVCLSLSALAGCSKNHGELVVDDTVGVTALRSPCPLVGIPEMTGDVTLLAPGRVDSNAIDAVATITNVRKTCDNALHLPKLTARVEFDVLARRTDPHGARHIDFPYFSVVERGGGTIVAKHVGVIGVDFADGQDRAQGHGSATAVIDRDDATLPPAIRARLMRKRKPGDTDAAVDPLSLPEVKAALAKATFEELIGFQLTEQQLAYNATR